VVLGRRAADHAACGQPGSKPLPDPLVELVAQRFRVLGEPMRIKLLDRLRDGSASVGELSDALGASQQNVSKHLAILHVAGMVSRTKEGNRAVYAISDPGVFELCDQVCGGVRRQLEDLDAMLPLVAGRATAGRGRASRTASASAPPAPGAPRRSDPR
jgi:DNA-binding transcriptional ArsR family regulator